jgi:hypothetical protein
MTSEKIFDLLPYVVDIFEKLDLQKFIEGNKDKDANALGNAVIMHVAKNSGKVKKEFFTAISIIKDITLEEAYKLPFSELIATLKELGKDPELLVFFKLAVQ